MPGDRVNELYRGEIFDQTNQEICRERVHWMCSRVTGEKVLDFGCSQGISSILLGREGHQVVGVDVDPEVIEYAQAELKNENESVRERVRFVLIKPGQLEFDDDSFDSVLFGEVLEHLTRPDRALSTIQRLCKPDGHVIITTPFGHLRHPNHVRTYFLSSFLETVRPFFGVRELEVQGKYICCLASNSGAGSDAPDIVTAERLLAISETNFDRAERDYLDQRERVRAQSHARRGEIQKLSEKLKVAQQRAEKSGEAARKFESEIQRRDADAKNRATERQSELASLTKEKDAELQKLHQSHSNALNASYAERERTLAAEVRDHAQERKRILQQHKTSRERMETALTAKLRKAQVSTEKRHKELVGVRKELAKAIADVAVARKDVDRQKKTLSEAQGAAASFRSRIARQKDQLELARAELDLRAMEVRYRLGDALVSAYYRPADLIRLPHRTVKLFLEGRRRIRERHEGDLAEAAFLAPPTPDRAEHTTTLVEGGKTQVRRNGPTPSLDSPTLTMPIEAPPTGKSKSLDELARDSSGEPKVAIDAEPREAKAGKEPPDHDKETPPPQITFEPSPRRNSVARLPLTVAAIMDEFTYECFRDECHLVQFESNNWKSKLIQDRPDLLLVESTWKGNGGSWKLQYPDNPALRALVDWCKSQGIPTAFWNKEDPPNFDRFIDSALLFDYIFTSDENCIPRYLERVEHKRVYALPFAAQPVIHNPIGSRGERRGNLCFAGTFYQVKYPQRRRDIESLLRPATSRGLTIFDRQHGYAARQAYRFPAEYEPYIQGGLSYLEMIEAYKSYHAFLNVNSVRESPTMFSRRVLELLASGTAVISTPSTGMERMLGSDALAIADSEQEAAEWMDKLIDDPEFRERMVILGQRRVFCEHTYEHRMRYILDTIGIQQPIPKRRVSIITVTNRPSCLDDAIKNYRRQAYPETEWIVVLNSDDYNLAQVKEKLAAVPNTRVFQRPQSDTLGACLNHGIDQSQFEFVAKFDDDDYYAEHYLTDMINAFLYCRTEIVGKRSYFAYLADKKCLAVRFPRWEHRHTKLVSGATLVMRRNLFEEQRFSEDIQRGVDTDFQRRCADRGFEVYSTDRFNFVANRASGEHNHTWGISDEEFLEKCEVVAQLDDFRPHITV